MPTHSAPRLSQLRVSRSGGSAGGAQRRSMAGAAVAGGPRPREERGLARRSAGERGCDVLERADLALVAAASARDLRGHGVNVRCCGRRERARRQQGEGSAGSTGAACGRPRFSRVVVPHRRHGRHRWVSVASVAQTVSAHRWHVRRWRAWAASVWNRRHRRHRHVA